MTAGIHEVRDVTVKGFGLYCLAYPISMMLSQLFVFLPNAGAPIFTLIIGFSVPLAYAVLGYLCVFRTRAVVQALWRDDELCASNPPLSALTSLVTLIGLYFAIQAVGLIVFIGWEARLPDAFSITSLIGAIATLALALWAIRRAAAIARFIQARTEHEAADHS